MSFKKIKSKKRPKMILFGSVFLIIGILFVFLLSPSSNHNYEPLNDSFWNLSSKSDVEMFIYNQDISYEKNNPIPNIILNIYGEYRLPSPFKTLDITLENPAHALYFKGFDGDEITNHLTIFINTNNFENLNYYLDHLENSPVNFKNISKNYYLKNSVIEKDFQISGKNVKFDLKVSLDYYGYVSVF